MLEKLEDLEDGSCLLLISGCLEERTFKDYKNLIQCLDGVVEIFEKYQDSEGRDNKNYGIDEIMAWINNSFNRVELFVFDKKINRYRRLPRNELQDLFMKLLQKVADSVPVNNLLITNGIKPGSEDDEDLSSENWDD